MDDALTPEEERIKELLAMGDAFTPEEERIKVLEKHLECAIGWLGHPPEPPEDGHSCGHPDSCCDGLCVEWAAFCEDFHAMKKALKGP